MQRRTTRRELLKSGAAGALASMAQTQTASAMPEERQTVRVGMVGVGNRGTALLRTLLTLQHV